MSLAIVYSRASSGMKAQLVTVETHLASGMAGFHIVGMPEAAVKESKDRVRSALMNANFDFPICRITVNLAPADFPKEGGRFDLPIALGILAALGYLPTDVLSDYEVIGELALTGELRRVHGILPIALATYQSKRQLIVPEQNAPEAALVQQASVLSARHLLDVCAHLRGTHLLTRCSMAAPPTVEEYPYDMRDIKGQPHAKRALEIAAAGRHSLLYVGPPGTGKTMLANRLPGILPDLSDEEALEVAAVASVSHSGFHHNQWKRVPFRSPHHSSSSAALVGGGHPPRPGEISLAHHGVLFLDELPEFARHVLEGLREPLESGHITISRAAFQTVFPACFQFIAAMNPCPCGYAGSPTDYCRCSSENIKRYMGKISGPLLDRIDMHVEVARLPVDTLMQASESEENSVVIKQRVIAARHYQQKRQGKLNTQLTVSELNRHAQVEPSALTLLQEAMIKFNFSMRVFHRVIKVARTIADLAGHSLVTEASIAEALNYRCLDRAKTPYLNAV